MWFRMVTFLSVVVCIFAGMVEAQGVSAKSLGTEECRWSDSFAVSDLDGEAMAMVVWDDGSGPALYVGGSFIRAGGRIAP